MQLYDCAGKNILSGKVERTAMIKTVLYYITVKWYGNFYQSREEVTNALLAILDHVTL